MPREEPIVVIGCARSGTSMTAGLFAQHGCWTGNCRPPDANNEKGYFENLDIKNVLLKRWGRLKKEQRVAEPEDGFRDRIERIVKGVSGHWVVKHGSLYWPAWHEYDPTFVCVYRAPESIMASAQGGIYMTREAICLTHGAMEWCQQHAGGVRVDYERCIDGDYTQLRRAFNVAGLTFDEDIADDWIDPELCHHRSDT